LRNTGRSFWTFRATRSFVTHISHMTPDNLYGSLHRKDESAFAVVTDGTVQGLLVRPGLPFRKYAVPLLAEAVRRNGPNRMMALVYTDAAEEIAAYAASGFEKVEGQNSVYASHRL